MTPFGVISDTHYHHFTQFGTINADGTSSRMWDAIAATYEAADLVAAQGGNVIVHCGDAFHVRGSVSPSVLNPVMDCYRDLIKRGFEVIAIPGNHDLEGNESQRVGNAVTTLESVGVLIAHSPMVHTSKSGHTFALLPWFSTKDELLAQMHKLASSADIAIIHAPIDGVLPHLPPHGLEANALASLGFKLVLSGHYHHHKDMGDGVYSVGALTHQTWSDAGSRAGFLIVENGVVKQYETSAPKFIALTGDEDESELPDLIRGNFIRVRAEFEDPSDIDVIRDELKKYGAAGIQINAIRKTVVTRATVSAKSGATLEGSIDNYCTKNGLTESAKKLAVEVLNKAREGVEA